MSQVEFLGFRVSKNGVQPGTKKLAAISEYARPTNASEVRKYLGLVSFFRKFVKNFAMIVSPISALLKKGTPFKGNEACENAFRELRQRLLSEPILVKFERSRPTRLYTDACGIGLGAILVQKVDDKWRLVYAVSRKLSDAETNYHSTRLEQLAAVWAMSRLRHYLSGLKFTLITDCTAVRALTATTPTG